MFAPLSRAVVVVTLALFAGGCAAAVPGPPPRNEAKAESAPKAEPIPEPIALAMKSGFPDPRSPLAHTRELAMFDDQAAPIRALAARTEERLAAIGSSRKSALDGLAALFDAVPADDAAIRAKLAEIAALDADAVRVQVDARLETRRILRPEQLVKLRALRSATTL